jgi:hypothetical protein
MNTPLSNGLQCRLLCAWRKLPAARVRAWWASRPSAPAHCAEPAPPPRHSNYALTAAQPRRGVRRSQRSHEGPLRALLSTPVDPRAAGVSCCWRRGITGPLQCSRIAIAGTTGYSTWGVCGPQRTAPPPCAAPLVGAACIPHGDCEAMAYSDTHWHGAAEMPRATPSPSRHGRKLRVMLPCTPAFGLLRHTVQWKCAACVLELCAAYLAVADIFRVAFSATAQRSQRYQALATMCDAGQCGADVRAVSTTRATLESTLHVPTDPTEGHTGTDGAATGLRPGGARSGASI